MGKNVLITGGAGYIGTLLAKRLVQEGHNVTVFDNLTYGENPLRRLDLLLDGVSLPSAFLNGRVSSSAKSHTNYRLIREDIRDREKVVDLISKGNFSYVFHFAELVGHFPCDADPTRARDINYVGTQNVVVGVLNAKNPPRLVYNSSSSVYHVSVDGTPFTEESPLPDFRTLDEYCKNKILSERHILSQAQNGGSFQFVIFRPATVGGLSPRMRIDLLPNHFTYVAMTTGKLSLANARDYRAVIDISDLIDLYASLIGTSNWTNGVFNAGNINLTKMDYASQIRRLAGLNDDFTTDAQSFGDTRNLTISSELAARTHGFSPKGGLEQIVLPLVGILRSNPLIFSPTSRDVLLVDQEFVNNIPQEFRKLSR